MTDKMLADTAEQWGLPKPKESNQDKGGDSNKALDRAFRKFKVDDLLGGKQNKRD